MAPRRLLVIDDHDDSSSEQLQHASQNPSPSTPISNPKPVPASKPIKAQAQAKKSGKKRVVTEDENNRSGDNSKRSKSKEAVFAAGGDRDSDEKEDDMQEDARLTSKKSFRKTFTEKDDLSILRGLADFLSNTGKNPMENISIFHDFVKGSLDATVTDKQLKRKIRGLRDRYQSNEIFTKSHDMEAFELFKKINWGENNGGNVAGEVNGKCVNEKISKKDVNVGKHIGSSSNNLESLVEGFSGFNKDAVKHGLEMIDVNIRAEMERRLRQLHVTELEVFMKRAQIMTELTSLIVEELKKLTD